MTIENVRNFKYRSETDYDQRWETRTYDLDRIKGVDLFLSFWGPTEIAHTIVSWDFDDGQHLAISIETRKAEGRIILCDTRLLPPVRALLCGRR